MPALVAVGLGGAVAALLVSQWLTGSTRSSVLTLGAGAALGGYAVYRLTR